MRGPDRRGDPARGRLGRPDRRAAAAGRRSRAAAGFTALHGRASGRARRRAPPPRRQPAGRRPPETSSCTSRTCSRWSTPCGPAAPRRWRSWAPGDLHQRGALRRQHPAAARQVFSPPFEIAAIGNPARMRAALDADPGVRAFRDAVAAFGLGYAVTTADDIGAGLLRLGHPRVRKGGPVGVPSPCGRRPTGPDRARHRRASDRTTVRPPIDRLPTREQRGPCASHSAGFTERAWATVAVGRHAAAAALGAVRPTIVRTADQSGAAAANRVSEAATTLIPYVVADDATAMLPRVRNDATSLIDRASRTRCRRSTAAQRLHCRNCAPTCEGSRRSRRSAPPGPSMPGRREAATRVSLGTIRSAGEVMITLGLVLLLFAGVRGLGQGGHRQRPPAATSTPSWTQEWGDPTVTRRTPTPPGPPPTAAPGRPAGRLDRPALHSPRWASTGWSSRASSRATSRTRPGHYPNTAQARPDRQLLRGRPPQPGHLLGPGQAASRRRDRGRDAHHVLRLPDDQSRSSTPTAVAGGRAGARTSRARRRPRPC